MSDLVDLGPAGERLLAVTATIGDAQLDSPTPCEGRTVGQMLQHLVGLCVAFRAAGEKDFGPLTDTSPDDAGWPEPQADWRDALSANVEALVAAWRSPESHEGMTRAGGVDLPGEVGVLVALDELVLHGWDVARATGQHYEPDPATTATLQAFVEGFDEGGTPGMFGPALTPGEDASAFDRVLARSGRDPHWSAG
ncbi:TIGR03086 family metal-binding protein [Microbacterium sp. ARD31]|uniref:TIGR03086 family metal-binding protein n=1 Tax=Microbacterium sp. ARD31 TaxID=2962576 RepID=UPI002881927A|nr:TIGR03086 family metal-binding protein [Microbacterium sp. ARD31]MDT0188549.1 TIGR03086 family metal-binding protein [Microbacterium sp. ARD31]